MEVIDLEQRIAARKRMRRRMRSVGYQISQRCRKKIGEWFGWGKTDASSGIESSNELLAGHTFILSAETNSRQPGMFCFAGFAAVRQRKAFCRSA